MKLAVTTSKVAVKQKKHKNVWQTVFSLIETFISKERTTYELGGQLPLSISLMTKLSVRPKFLEHTFPYDFEGLLSICF
jgi:hypothetical protein